MFTVKLKLPEDSAAPVAALLELIEHSIVQREDRERGETWLEMFFSTREEADAESENLAAILGMFGCEDIGVATVEESPDRDWQEAWKEHFHAIRVSDRITVAPSWEHVSGSAGQVVVQLDPGMSFGTGRHWTTRACLRCLDELALAGAGPSLCDVGCGSGVLSIAAAKLGFRPVVAFDNDPLAVRIARENLELNGVGGVVVEQVDLAADEPGGQQFDVVVANMLANLLDAFAVGIGSRLKRHAEARLILAGMLGEGQYAWTRAMFERLGLREREHRCDDEWICMVMGW